MKKLVPLKEIIIPRDMSGGEETTTINMSGNEEVVVVNMGGVRKSATINMGKGKKLVPLKKIMVL